MIDGRVLINGGGGFLGRHAVEVFAEAGCRLRVTDQPGMPLGWAREMGFEAVHADLRDLTQALEVTEGCTHVVNIAGVYSFDRPYQELYAGNVTVTENMCRASTRAKVVKFVHIATIGVFGFPKYTPMDENGPKRPKNNYELTKRMGEDVVVHFQRQLGLPAAILRPGPIYGPRDRNVHSVLFALISMMVLGSETRNFVFDDSPYCHHIHVRDVARATLHLMETSRSIGNTYLCCDKTPIKWNELMHLVYQCIGHQPARIRKWSQPLQFAISRLGARLVPQFIYDFIGGRVEDAWLTVCQEHNLEPVLVPRLERDMMGYLLGDHIYDTSALDALGFEWEFPDIADGLKNTYDFLVKNRWIPDLR